MLLMTAANLYAEAPNLLTYQGRLKESGQAITGTRTVKIYLCDAETDGNIYSSGQQAVTVSNGLFRSTFTVPSGANLSSGNWYLEIWVGGTKLTPRERLTSSAYALFSGTAAFAAVLPASGVQGGDLNSNVIVSSVAIGAVQDASIISVSASKLTGALPALDGSALTNTGGPQFAAVAADTTTIAANLGNYLPKAGGTMTGTLTINAASALTTGNQAALVISTNVYISDSQLRVGNFAAAPDAASLGKGAVYYDTVADSLYVSNGAGWVQLASGGASPWGEGAGAVTLNTNSNTVGIGKAPGEKLDVAGSIKSDYGLIAATGAFSGNVGVDGNFTANSGQGNQVVLSSTTVYGTLSVTGEIVAAAGSAAYLTSTQTFSGQNTFTAQVSVSSNLIVTNGNVGISTGAPQARLDVLAAGSSASDMAQIWRDSNGSIISSVSATGNFSANAGNFHGPVNISSYVAMGYVVQSTTSLSSELQMRAGCGTDYMAIGGGAMAALGSVRAAYPSTDTASNPSAAGTMAVNGAIAAHSWSCEFDTESTNHRCWAVCLRVAN